MIPLPHIAFLTIADMAGYVSDDELAAAVLRARGARVTSLPWDSRPDWRAFDLVVVRTTWDYQARLQEFLAVLQTIEDLGVPLCNNTAVARWNARKTYLRDLSAAGVPIVPALFVERLVSADALPGYFATLDTEEIILKPQISASAYDTYRLRPDDVAGLEPELRRVFGARPFLVQPFMPHILSEGEFSLIYLDGQYSHAVLKRPRPGDFRSQEEYGGVIAAVAADTALRAAGDAAMVPAGEGLLFGRVDLVRGADETLQLMELELIEPALYLRMDPAAPARFAEAILRRL